MRRLPLTPSGEIVSDVVIGVPSDVARTVAADAVRGDGDVIDAGQGDNLVFGDNGQITAAAADVVNFGTQPMTLGLVETIESLIGGSDTITTGVGRDIVLGGIDADTIVANFGEYKFDEHAVPVALGADANNIVIGDSGYIDWTGARRRAGCTRIRRRRRRARARATTMIRARLTGSSRPSPTTLAATGSPRVTATTS